MKTNYNIKNFRIFGEEGAEARIAPFTVITGCNSSGKSSIAKSILLLDTFLQKVKKASDNKSVLELDSYTLDFNVYPLNLLGRFDKVVNQDSKTGEIEFTYTTQKDLEVTLVFITNSADYLNRGYLKSLKILKNGTQVYATENGVCKLNTIPFLLEYLQHTHNFLNPDFYYIEDNLDYHEIAAEIQRYEKTNKVSLNVINWAIENESLFKVPLLDIVGGLDKSDFLHKTIEIFAPAYEKVGGLDLFIHRLAEVFENSEYDSFSDFFKAKEKKWMSNLHNGWDLSLYLDEGLKIPKSWHHVDSECTIQDELWFNILSELSKGDKSFTETLQNNDINFSFLLTTLTIVGEMIGLEHDKLFSERVKLKDFEYDIIGLHHHTIFYLWEDFKRIVNNRLRNALMPVWSGKTSYVGSSRIDVQRLYTLDSKTDFAALLNRYFNARRDFVGLKEYDHEKGYEPDAFMNKWLNKFGICDSVSLDLDPEGLGVSIKLHKKDKTSLLADEGYGITQLFSILMEIETGIQNAFHHFLVKGWHGQNYYNYEKDMDTDKVLFPEQTIIIEEPEIHLHPKFQSLLVDMFAEAYEKYNIHFIIETHSEYLIRRLQVRVAEKKMSAEDVSVIYVDEGGHPYNMELCNDGFFDKKFGEGFFDEAGRSHMSLLKMGRKGNV